MKEINPGRVMLFPYNEAMENIIRFEGLLSFAIGPVVSPGGSGLCGRDPLSIWSGGSSQYVISEDFEGELQKADTVILGSFDNYGIDKGQIHGYVRTILEKGKNLVALDHSLLPELLRYRQDFHQKGLELTDYQANKLITKAVENISVPAVGVFGMEADCGKTGLLLLAFCGLRAMGYRVSLIGSDMSLGLFGGHVYPEPLYSQELGELDKIRGIRNFASGIIREETPDMLLFSCPYGLNRFAGRDVQYQSNGLLSHMLIDALQPDINLLCVNIDRDLKWIRRSKETLEYLSCSETTAIAARRRQLSDEIFGPALGDIESYLEVRAIDQDRAKSEEVASMLLQRLEECNKITGII